MISTENTKHRHSFKALKLMFDADKLTPGYLWHNVSRKEWQTFINGMHKNLHIHVPDGAVFSKNQLNVLKRDLFIVPCLDKENIYMQYHSKWFSEKYCTDCIAHRKHNNLIQKLMPTFTVTNDAECECAICMETGGKFAKLDCDHKFHKNCISRWLIKSLTCPCCRKKYE
jgi:hypothetical protein